MKRAVFGLCALLSLSAQAQGLRELLQAAEEYNRDRNISLERRRQAAASFGAAWSGLLPSLTAQGGWTNNQFPVEDVVFAPGAPPLTIIPRNQLDAVFRLELPLVDPTSWFTAAAAGATEDAADHRDAQVVDGLRKQVSSTYYAFAAALAVREAAQKSLAVAEAQRKLQDIRVKAGAATELEVMRANAEVQRNRQTLADTQALVANLRRSLRTLTGLELDDAATLPQDNLAQVGTLDDLEARTEELPAVKAADREAVAASRSATATRLTLVPRVTANFTERLTNATGFAGQAHAYTAGVGLLWRLDGPTFFRMSAAGAQAQIAALVADRQRLETRDQIHSDWRRLTTAIEKVTAARAQVAAAQRAAEVARDRYAVGAATQLDVIQAERDLFSAEVNQIQARTELASSQVSLRISAALPLNL